MSAWPCAAPHNINPENTPPRMPAPKLVAGAIAPIPTPLRAGRRVRVDAGPGKPMKTRKNKDKSVASITASGDEASSEDPDAMPTDPAAQLAALEVDPAAQLAAGFLVPPVVATAP